MTTLVCDACGTPFSTERSYGAHAKGGRTCRARQHAYAISAKDMVLVLGDESIDLSEAGIEIKYGPAPRPRSELQGSSPHAPTWAVEVYRAMQAIACGSDTTRRVLESLAKNDEHKGALLAIAGLGNLDGGSAQGSILELLVALGYLSENVARAALPLEDL